MNKPIELRDPDHGRLRDPGTGRAWHSAALKTGAGVCVLALLVAIAMHAPAAPEPASLQPASANASASVPFYYFPSQFQLNAKDPPDTQPPTF
jgi:hypothetical protein